MRKTMFVGAVMTAALLGCGKKPEKKNDGGDSTPPPAAGSAGSGGGSSGGGNSGGILPSGGIGIVVNPNQALGGGGGGGGVGATLKTAKRNEIRFALEDLKILLNDYSLVNDKLPTPQETHAMVKKSAPKYGKFIEDGDIVIHAAKSREDVWAYEAKPPFGKHMVLTAQGIEDMDPDMLRTRLGTK